MRSEQQMQVGVLFRGVPVLGPKVVIFTDMLLVLHACLLIEYEHTWGKGLPLAWIRIRALT